MTYELCPHCGKPVDKRPALSGDDTPLWAVLMGKPHSGYWSRLVHNGIRTVGDARRISDDELMRLPNVGRRTIAGLRKYVPYDPD